MFKLVRKIFKAVAIFIVAIVCYLIFAILLSYITVNSDTNLKASNELIPIYILSNGVHTDVVLPVKNEFKDWTSQIPFSDTVSKDSIMNFVAFGWGDKGFYLDTPTWADLKTSTALKAVSGFNTTAMHVTYYKKMLENEKCVKLYIESKNYLKLVKYIESSFQLNSNSFTKIDTDAVYGKNDIFYDAKGHYSLFYTCNSWTNQALKAANQKAALWTIFDFGILNHYQED